MPDEIKDLTGENVYHENRRIGAVEANNTFVPCAELTEDDVAYVQSLGLTVPEDWLPKEPGDTPDEHVPDDSL